MTIHEYGKSNAKTVVLVHPSVVMWDFFEYLIPLLEKDCHVIIPALPGYDENDSQQNFTSVENIAGELQQRARTFLEEQDERYAEYRKAHQKRIFSIESVANKLSEYFMS